MRLKRQGWGKFEERRKIGEKNKENKRKVVHGQYTNGQKLMSFRGVNATSPSPLNVQASATTGCAWLCVLYFVLYYLLCCTYSRKRILEKVVIFVYTCLCNSLSLLRFFLFVRLLPTVPYNTKYLLITKTMSYDSPRAPERSFNSRLTKEEVVTTPNIFALLL